MSLENKWEVILNQIGTYKEEFNRSYKCLNIKTKPTKQTFERHFQILEKTYNEIRALLHVNFNRLSTEHKKEALDIFGKLRDRLLRLSGRYKLRIFIPKTIDRVLDVNVLDENLESADSAESDSENSGSDSFSSADLDIKMPLNTIDFLNLATKILPDFDGKPENLTRFLDAINLAKTQSAGHEETLVSIIKTKLTGSTRNVISDEQTVDAIVATLKKKIKGESTEVISAKILNVKQNSKSANAFTAEIEELTKSLENAFISDGVPHDLAQKYSTQTAIKALSSNAANDKVRLVMQAGQFSNMNEAVAKFVSTSTEMGQSAHVFRYQSNRAKNRQNFNRSNSNNRSRNPRYRGNSNRNQMNRYRYRTGNQGYQSNVYQRSMGRNNNNGNVHFLSNNPHPHPNNHLAPSQLGDLPDLVVG